MTNFLSVYFSIFNSKQASITMKQHFLFLLLVMILDFLSFTQQTALPICTERKCGRFQNCLVWETGEEYCVDFCAEGRCPSNEICELNPITCVRSPCPPHAANCKPVGGPTTEAPNIIEVIDAPSEKKKARGKKRKNRKKAFRDIYWIA
jgi:hypothetical protein